jgi:hypothetical protein
MASTNITGQYCSYPLLILTCAVRTRPSCNEKRRARDILMKLGILDLFLARELIGNVFRSEK